MEEGQPFFVGIDLVTGLDSLCIYIWEKPGLVPGLARLAESPGL